MLGGTELQAVSRNSGQPLAAEGGPQPPASRKLMLSVLQLQGNEFCSAIRRNWGADSLLVEPWGAKPPALADSDCSL